MRQLSTADFYTPIFPLYDILSCALGIKNSCKVLSNLANPRAILVHRWQQEPSLSRTLPLFGKFPGLPTLIPSLKCPCHSSLAIEERPSVESSSELIIC